MAKSWPEVQSQGSWCRSRLRVWPERRGAAGVRIVVVALAVFWLLASAAVAAEIRVDGRLDGPLDALDALGRLRDVGTFVPVAGVEPSARAVNLRVDGAGRFEVRLRGAVAWRLELRVDGFLPLDRWIAPLPERQTLGPVPLIRAELESLRVERPDAVDEFAGRAARTWVVEERSILPTVHREALAVGGWRRALRSDWAEAADGDAGDVSWTFVRAAGEQLVLRAASRWGASRVAIGPREGAGAVEQAPFAQRRLLELELVDEAGRPLAAADVVVDSLPVGRSDEQGRMRLEVGVREDGSAALVEVSSGAGVVRWQPDPGELEQGSVRRTVPAAPEVRGVVRSADGRVLSGAWVIAGARATRSDARGRFSLPAGPSAVDGRAWVGLAGYLPGELESWPEGEIVLQPSQVLSGEVVGPDGAALPGVEISAVPAAAGGRGRFALSDAAGRFRFVQLPADRLVEVAAGRLDRPRRLWPLVRMQVTTPDAGIEMPALQVVMRPVRPAEGWVVDSADRPIEGAQVVLEESAGIGSPARRLSAVTDEQGRWVVNDLPFDLMQIYGRAAGYAPTFERSVRVDSAEAAPTGRPVAVGTLTLEPEATLQLHILDAEGESAVGALVRYRGGVPRAPRASSGPRRGRTLSLATDLEGNVSLPELVAGERVSIEVEHIGHVLGRLRNVRVPADLPVEVRLERAASVAGRCLASDGSPLSGARVAIKSADPSVSLPGELAERCDGQGRFEIGGVPAGKVVAWGRAYGLPDFVEVSLEVDAGERRTGVDLRVPPSGTVRGVVQSSGGAVVGATVRCCALPTVQTDEAGWYELAGAAEGAHQVEAESEEHGVASVDVVVRAGAENRVDLELRRLLSLEGRVLEPGGRPIAGASVWLSRDSPSVVRRRSRRTQTDTEGWFQFVGLRAGPVSLWARRWRGDAQDTRQLDLELSRDRHSVDVVLGGTARITGRVVGLEQHELLRVSVSAQGSGGSVSGRVGDDGTFSIDGLAAGETTVVATFLERRLERRETFELREGGHQEVEFDFDDLERVQLEVTLPVASRPLAQSGLALSAAIQARPDGEPQQGSFATFDATGRARFEQQQSGFWHVSVGAAGTVLAPVWSGWVESDRTIELALEKVRVSGVLLGGDGSPVTERYLAIASQSAQRIVQRSWIPVDAEGRFDFQAVVNGPYRIVLLPERSAMTAGVEPLLLAELVGPQSGLVLTVP